jgi:hypothetical protein
MFVLGTLIIVKFNEIKTNLKLLFVVKRNDEWSAEKTDPYTFYFLF